MRFKMLLVLLVILFAACKQDDSCKDAELGTPKGAFTGNQFRINGYYFGDTDSSSSRPFANIYFFYKNGIFLTTEAEDLAVAKAGNIDVNRYAEAIKKTKWFWGVYKVEGTTIEIERWYPASYGCVQTVYQQGRILNDSSFIITAREYRDGNKTSSESPASLFSFRPLTQKPDSTNVFIQ